MTQPTFRSGSRAERAGTSASSGVAATVNAAIEPISGGLLVLRCGAFIRNATTVTVSDNRGNTWTQQVLTLNNNGGSTNVASGIWTCSPTTVTTPFTVSFNPVSPGGTHFSGLVLDEIENFDATTPIEVAGAGSTGTSTTPVAAIADNANDALKLGAASCWHAATFSAGSGWTLDGTLNVNSPNQAASCVSKGVTGADTTDPTWSLTASGAWTASGLAIRGASGSITGTLATTNTNDTMSAAGSPTDSGASAATGGNDTMAASGTTTVVGSMAAVNGDDTMAASGSPGDAVAGSMDATNQDDSMAASGTTTVVGVMATQAGNDTMGAAGTPSVNGSMTALNQNDTMAASGTSGTPGAGGRLRPMVGFGQ